MHQVSIDGGRLVHQVSCITHTQFVSCGTWIFRIRVKFCVIVFVFQEENSRRKIPGGMSFYRNCIAISSCVILIKREAGGCLIV